eukprot:tig00001095_g7026.t1
MSAGPPAWLAEARKAAAKAGHATSAVSHLDLSGKGITSTAGIEEFRSVVALFLLDNQLETLQGLHVMTRLKHLYIQTNLIRYLRGLENCRALEKLYANNNFISRLEGLQNCSSLVELHLQSQQIPPGEPFSFDPLSIQALSGSLTVLNLSGCGVAECAPLGALRALERLNLSSNALASFADVAQMLEGARSLQELDARFNPVAGHRRWRREALGRGAALRVLDEKAVTPMERDNVAVTTALRPGPMDDLDALDLRGSKASFRAPAPPPPPRPGPRASFGPPEPRAPPAAAHGHGHPPQHGQAAGQGHAPGHSHARAEAGRRWRWRRGPPRWTPSAAASGGPRPAPAPSSPPPRPSRSHPA